MPYDLTRKFVIGISSRALFDLARENAIFISKGSAAYNQYQRANQEKQLPPGPAYHLIQRLLSLNILLPEERGVEVVLISRNSPDAGIRISNSIEKCKLEISRKVFLSGASASPYLRPFSVDLFLSADSNDVEAAHVAGVASALVWGLPKCFAVNKDDPIRIAFDGDGVLFSDESERVFQKQGIAAFRENELSKALRPLTAGPLHRVLISLAYLQRFLPTNPKVIEIALVTARNAPADKRALLTLKAWGIEVDQTFFLGGVNKHEILAAFRPHLFFDDQKHHCVRSSKVVPTAQVPSSLEPIEGELECPECGSLMTVRHAEKGENAGRPFYGCSNFPKCRRTASIA